MLRTSRLAVLCLSLAPPAFAQPEPAMEAIGPFTKIASNATYGCRRPHGFGLYDAGVDTTFLCWNGGGMSVYGRTYQHGTKTWSPIKEITHNNWTTTYAYHDYPNMAQAPDGRLLITFAQHTKELHISRARQPHDLLGEWDETVIDRKTGYPMIFSWRDKVYIFYIVNEDLKWPHRSFGCIRSDDSGASWSDHVPAIDSAKQDPDHIDEVYADHFMIVPGRAGGPDKIQFTWVMRGGPKGHNQGSRSAYFAYFLPDTGTWEAVDGTGLGDLIDYAEMNANCVFQDTGPVPEGRSINTTMSSYHTDGRPFILYEFERATWQASWTGQKWEHENLGKQVVDDLQRLPDGSHRMLISPGGQPSLQLRVQDAAGGPWQTVMDEKIPYQDGANRTWSIGFIDDARPELEAVMSQLNNTEERTNYRGVWPVWVLDVRSCLGGQP